MLTFGGHSLIDGLESVLGPWNHSKRLEMSAQVLEIQRYQFILQLCGDNI